MTDDLQNLWYEHCIKAIAPNLSEDARLRCWDRITGDDIAFCNKTGPRSTGTNGQLLFHDAIRGTGGGQPGFTLQNTICHGASVMLTQPPVWMFRDWYIEFMVMDAFDPNTLNMRPQKEWWLFTPAITWNRMYLADKKTVDSLWPFGRANPFPWLDGGIPGETPFVPMLGNHVSVSYLEADWIGFATPGMKFPINPFFPNNWRAFP